MIIKQIVHGNGSIIKLIFLLSSILSLSMSMGMVSADPGVIYVNNATGNDSYNGQSPVYNSATGDGPKLSIKNATKTVTPNGVVSIAKGLYTGEGNRNIQIDHNMTISGAGQSGTTIDAEKMGRMFLINTGVTATIQDLKLENGYADEGGSIYNKGTLTLQNITLQNHTAKDGGAIYNTGTLTVTSCSFKGNRATYDSGGAIFNHDGGTITLKGCTFTGNIATYGGAICNYNYSLLRSLTDPERRMQITSVFNGTYSTINVAGCTFTGNTASYYGGAITSNNYGRLMVEKSTFINNTAERYGGAINNDFYSTANIIWCTFTGNSATDGSGGAIDNYFHGTCDVTDSTFTDNHANYGGAICNDDYGPLTVKRCTLTGNTANLDGGAINGDDESVITVKNSVFKGNTALNGSGGAIDNYRSTLTVQESTFTGNQAKNGGAMNNYFGTITVTGSVITGNTASGSCGGIYNYGGNLVAHFNRVYNGPSPYNGIWNERRGSVDADYNWWGSNENPATQAHNVTIYRWMVLVVVADPTEIYNGEVSNIIASFNWSTDGNTTTPLNHKDGEHIPDYTPVTFKSTIGSISGYPVGTVNGVAITKLRAIQTAGTSYVSALIDSYNVSSTSPNVKVTIFKAPTTLTANKVSGYLGNKINLTASLKGRNGEGLAGKTVIFTVGNVSYSAVTGKNGLATYRGYIVKQKSGTYIISATFKGDTGYIPSSKTAILTVKPSSSLNFTMTVSRGPYYIGNTVYYHLEVKNKGPNTATGVSVFDKLPSGLKYLSSRANKGSYKSSTNRWTIGTLKTGQKARLTIKALIDKAGNIKNTATVTQTTYLQKPISKTVRVTVSSAITISQLARSAGLVKTYYRSHHTLPSRVVVSNRSLSMPQFLKLLVTATQNINRKHQNPMKDSAFRDPTGSGGYHIPGNLYKKEYLGVAKNIVNFMSTHKRAPNYARSSLGRISFSRLVYTYSKIIDFHRLKNRLPNFVNI